MRTAGLTALLQMEMENWSGGGVRPCRPLSQCTQPQRAVFLTGVTVEAAAQVEETEEEEMEGGEEYMKISVRS